MTIDNPEYFSLLSSQSEDHPPSKMFTSERPPLPPKPSSTTSPSTGIQRSHSCLGSSDIARSNFLGTNLSASSFSRHAKSDQGGGGSKSADNSPKGINFGAKFGSGSSSGKTAEAELELSRSRSVTKGIDIAGKIRNSLHSC